MAFSIVCPHCDVEILSRQRRPAGSRVTCPDCDRAFKTRVAAQRTDDDEEEPPRRRARKKTATAPRRKVPPVLIVGIGAGAFILLLGVGLLLYFFSGGSGKPATNDLLVYTPADAVILSGYDLDELGRHDGFRRSLERQAPGDLVELDRGGLPAKELSRVLIARTANNGNCCVVRFKNAPDSQKYLKAKAGQRYSDFTSLNGQYRYGYFVDATTLILADKEPAMQDLVEKGAKARIGNDLRAMLDKARGPVWRATGRLSPSDHERFGRNDDGFSIRVAPSAGSVVWLVPAGSQGEVHFHWSFENAGKATQAAATLRGMFQTQRGQFEMGQFPRGTDSGDISDIRKGYEQADVSQRSEALSATLDLPASEALRAVGSVRQ